jgi:transcriptional regulator GlxA family with amidase domain
MSETTVAIAVWDGVEELDVVGPYEVLSAWAARANGRPIRVYTVAEHPGEVRCGHGLRLLPDRTWPEMGEVDVLVLPDGGTARQVDDERVLARVRTLNEKGTLLTSVCTGSLVLAAAGLLEGRPATTHWGNLHMLAAYDGVEVRPDDRFVDTGSIVTSAGVSAGIDMALHLIARLDSPEQAKAVRRYIQYDPQPPV